MTLSERACVKPFQSSLGALGHNTPSLLTTVASGAAVNKPPCYYTRLALRTCVCVCFNAIQRHFPPNSVQDCWYVVVHYSRMRGFICLFVLFYFTKLENAPFRSKSWWHPDVHRSRFIEGIFFPTVEICPITVLLLLSVATAT